MYSHFSSWSHTIGNVSSNLSINHLHTLQLPRLPSSVIFPKCHLYSSDCDKLWLVNSQDAGLWLVINCDKLCCTNVWCLESQLYFGGAERLLLLPPICWQMTGIILCNNFLGLISTAPKGILICLHRTQPVMTNQRLASWLRTNQSLGMHYGIITLHKATLHHICTSGTC